jgi:hypothetical protein
MSLMTLRIYHAILQYIRCFLWRLVPWLCAYASNDDAVMAR